MMIINFLATFKITVHTFYFLQPQKHRRWGEGTIPEETLDAFDRMHEDAVNQHEHQQRFGESMINGY